MVRDRIDDVPAVTLKVGAPTTTVHVGGTVTRYLSSAMLPMELTVTAITDQFIVCGDYKFDRVHGYEVDEDLGWGRRGADGIVTTGSFLKL